MLSLKILTTKKDPSLQLFFIPDILEKWDIEPFFYEDIMKMEHVPVFAKTHIYLRDPFNAAISSTEIRPFFEAFIKTNSDSTYIDTISNVEDIYFEDKWRQYQVFSEFMPKTFQASEQFKAEYELLYKKRISSRARGISFDRPQVDLQQYIAQERLNIVEEYRVIQVCQNILEDVVIKSSKTEHQKVKVQKALPIAEDVKEFIARIQKQHTLDLVGYDIARTQDNTLYLIEVNRSPQLVAYVRETGVNPFRILLEYIAQV